MNSQWMTTLLSKGIELEQGLRKSVEQAQTQIKKELETRGIRLSAADLAALVEDLVPAASRTALDGALDYLRPFTAGLGFRVARLSDTQIELVVPAREKNRDAAGRLHESILTAAGIEAAKLLWTRHAPLGDFEIQILSMTLEIHHPPRTELRARLELPETVRENALAQIRREREAKSELALRFVGADDQSIADMTLHLKLRHVPGLGAPAE